MGCGKGQGGGSQRDGARGWAKGGGVRGWNLYLNEVFYKTGIVSSDSGVVTHVTTRNCTWNHGGIPDFWGNPCSDIIISQKCHVLIPEESENEMCKRFHLIIYARRSSHLGKLKKMPHFEISNSNIKGIRQPIGPKLEISAILRWI